MNLALRWFHVFVAIMWVGQTYYFTWLDRQFIRMEKTGGDVPALWMVHSGGFYKVEKKSTLGVPASQIRWFKWEALMTWIAGMLLLIVVYYLGSGLVDADVADISKAAGIGVGLGCLLAGWIIYNAALRSPLGRSQAGFTVFAFAMIAAFSYALLHLLSARAAYLHVGAMLGTIMTFNVWDGILPAQRKMLAAAEAGDPFDQNLSAQAKLRSKHNTFLAVPAVLLMLSNHYPVGTYGNRYAWPILLVLVIVGWSAAKLIREH